MIRKIFGILVSCLMIVVGALLSYAVTPPELAVILSFPLVIVAVIVLIWSGVLDRFLYP